MEGSSNNAVIRVYHRDLVTSPLEGFDRASLEQDVLRYLEARSYAPKVIELSWSKTEWVKWITGVHARTTFQRRVRGSDVESTQVYERDTLHYSISYTGTAPLEGLEVASAMRAGVAKVVARAQGEPGIFHEELSIYCSASRSGAAGAKVHIALNIDLGNTLEGVATWAADAGGLAVDEHQAGLQWTKAEVKVVQGGAIIGVLTLELLPTTVTSASDEQ